MIDASFRFATIMDLYEKDEEYIRFYTLIWFGVRELKILSLGFGVRELKTRTKNALSSHIKVGRFVRNYFRYFLRY